MRNEGKPELILRYDLKPLNLLSCLVHVVSFGFITWLMRMRIVMRARHSESIHFRTE